MTHPPIPQHYEVPIGTQPSKCRGTGCGATIYFVRTPRGSMMPIDCDHCTKECCHPTEGAPLFGEVDDSPGRGVPHFATCPAADEFSRGNRR